MNERAPTGFFEERPGVKSSMRLMCVICVLAAVTCAVIGTLRPGNPDVIYLVGLLLGAGIGGKVTQKATGEQAPVPSS